MRPRFEDEPLYTVLEIAHYVKEDPRFYVEWVQDELDGGASPKETKAYLTDPEWRYLVTHGLGGVAPETISEETIRKRGGDPTAIGGGGIFLTDDFEDCGDYLADHVDEWHDDQLVSVTVGTKRAFEDHEDVLLRDDLAFSERATRFTSTPR